MDRSLEDVIAERRPQAGGRGRREPREPREPREAPRRDDYARDGVRKPAPRAGNRHLDEEWTHDRYEDNYHARGRSRDTRAVDSYVPGEDRFDDALGRISSAIVDARSRRPAPEGSAKLRVENLHYEIGPEDIKELFRRIGDIASCELLYDRQDRSRGIAYVTYFDERDARDAIREFDGANAYGQPIRLSLVPAGPNGRPGKGPREPAGRSLFDRIDGGRSRLRSASPSSRERRGDRGVPSSTGAPPPPESIDRYVPGQGRRRSPAPRRGDDRRTGGRRGRDGGGRGGRARDTEGRPAAGGRPRKTAEELDAEMADYWGPSGGGGGEATTNGSTGAQPAAAGGAAPAPAPAPAPVAQAGDGDIDMIE